MAHILLIDNALSHELYRPFIHWRLAVPEEVRMSSVHALAEALPVDLSPYSHIIVSGSEASICQRADWAEREAVWLREEVIQRGLPILGSCWGHQLMAYALAGEEATADAVPLAQDLPPRRDGEGELSAEPTKGVEVPRTERPVLTACLAHDLPPRRDGEGEVSAEPTKGVDVPRTERPVLTACLARDSGRGGRGEGTSADTAIGRAPEPELGWIEVDVLDPDDPLIGPLHPRFTVLNLHFDEVRVLPSGFVATARSAGCAIQAMRHRSLPFFGLQSHPETPAEAGLMFLKNLTNREPPAGDMARRALAEGPKGEEVVRGVMRRFLGLR